MQASLRIWILCIMIAVLVYYLYIRRTEGFATIEVVNTPSSYPNNINSNAISTRETACSELRTLRVKYMETIAELRNKMNDLSGTQVLAYKLKNENMKYQYEFSEKCTDLVNRTSFTGLENVPRTACIDLASGDDPLYNTIIPGYDTTNMKLYQEEITIQDNLDTINDTIELTGCDVSGFEISVDYDIGTVNTEELRAKLNELSPYYISPGTLDFVTTYLVGNGILDTALFTSSEILKSVKSSLTFIKGISDKQFPP